MDNSYYDIQAQQLGIGPRHPGLGLLRDIGISNGYYTPKDFSPPKKKIPMNGKIVVAQENEVIDTFDDMDAAIIFAKSFASQHVGKLYIYECVFVLESSYNVEVSEVNPPLLSK